MYIPFTYDIGAFHQLGQPAFKQISNMGAPLRFPPPPPVR